MGTRASIAIKNRDGTIESIYVHWDGYLMGVGTILLEHYQTEERVRQLLALGDISSLGSTPGVGYTVAYARDMGEKKLAHSVSPGTKEWLQDYGQEYSYLFVPAYNCWTVWPWAQSTFDEGIDLADAVKEEMLRRMKGSS